MCWFLLERKSFLARVDLCGELAFAERTKPHRLVLHTSTYGSSVTVTQPQ